MRARRHSVVRLALSATAASLALAVGLSGGANASRTAVAATLSSCVITQDRSVGSTTTTSIEFVNQTAGTVTVYWLAFDGSRQFWFNLPAGQSIVQNTYVGHAWLVTDSTGTCVGYVVAEQAPKRYVIEGGTPPPAPPVSPPPGATTFTDPAGDGGRGPDITTVAVSNDASGQISFQLAFANRTKLVGNNDTITLCLDTDRSAGTGLQNPSLCPPGAEYVLYVIWEAGIAFRHWNGSSLEVAPHNTVKISDTGGATISINRSELDGTGAFNFQLSTEPPGDTAPNSGTWSYTVNTTPAPPPTTSRGRTLRGTPRADVLRGTPGPDKLYGKAGNDRLYGYDGDDLLVGGPGADRLFCGAGRDTAIADKRDKVAKDCEVVRGIPKPPGASRPTIRTTAGTLAITDVQLTDRFPPGCALNTPICGRPKAGYQVLVIWLERTDGGNPGDLAQKLDAASRGSYIQASDGSRGEREAAGLLSGRLMVAYTPRASGHDFTLYWPGNDPIRLGK